MPPPTTPSAVMVMVSGALNVTSSGRTFTLSRGKSLPTPSDHFTSTCSNGSYSRSPRTYAFTSRMSPPTVALIPCSETMIRPVTLHCLASVSCHSRTASGSASGVKT